MNNATGAVKNNQAVDYDFGVLLKNSPRTRDAAVIVDCLQTVEISGSRKELYEAALKNFSRVLVVVPVSLAGLDRNEFLDFPARAAMIRHYFPQSEVFPNNIGLNIIPIPDMTTAEQWSSTLDARIKEVLPLDKVAIFDMTKRRGIYPGWDDGSRQTRRYVGSLPAVSAGAGESLAPYLKQVMSTKAFFAGMLYAQYQMYRRINPTVDIAIIDYDRKAILLGRKKDEVHYRFVGGHYDGSDESYRASAHRELCEETGMEFGNLEYVTDHKVADWRYPNSTSVICTVLYAAPFVFGSVPKAKDDIVEVRWFKLAGSEAPDLTTLNRDLMIAEHRPLFDDLAVFIAKKFELIPISVG